MLPDYVTRPFRLYAKFDGRSTRREFLCFSVILWMALFAAFCLGDALDKPASHDWAVALCGIVVLALIVPGLAVKVRRLHDMDLSGWWVVASGVPYLGFLVDLFFVFKAGDATDNRFGANPRLAAGATA
ncbi:DUF805 domain-containing protein [Sphingomonas taxi]|uniref:DUF805 domain-containing protein n=1 Tax=Sphingomonas taxi TaxID=1549858 RepID=UPI00068C90F4|nr:DUF805 domain-containing protein [Sphingomonas taxi]